MNDDWKALEAQVRFRELVKGREGQKGERWTLA
jgi:hypothetical protein